MTPAQLEQLAREAGATQLVDVANPGRKAPLSFAPKALARFAGLIRAAAMEEAAEVCEAERLEFLEQAAANNSRASDIAFGSTNSADRLRDAIRALAKPKAQSTPTKGQA